MAAKSNAPPSGPVPEYDPEIKDMASYIHNYKIDSELAVRIYNAMNLAIGAQH